MFRLMVGFLVFALASSAAISQPVLGLADFKIDMTIEEFLEVPDVKARKIMDIGFDRSEINLNPLKTIFKKTSESKFSVDRYAWKNLRSSPTRVAERIVLADHVAYRLIMGLNFPDGDGKDEHELYLEFINGKLFSIEMAVKDLKFEEALEYKYGAPIAEAKKGTSVCKDRNGINQEYPREFHKKTWGKGKSITATFVRNYELCPVDIWTYYFIESKAAATVRQAHKREEEIQRNSTKAAEQERFRQKAAASKL